MSRIPQLLQLAQDELGTIFHQSRRTPDRDGPFLDRWLRFASAQRL